jgi:hypothetical protein
LGWTTLEAMNYSEEEQEEEKSRDWSLRRKAAQQLPATREPAVKKEECTSAYGQTCRALTALQQVAPAVSAEPIPAAPSVRSPARWSQSLRAALHRYVQMRYYD